MEPVRGNAAARVRAEQEAAARRRKISIRVGILGLLLLFSGGVSILVSPSDAALLVALMATGIVLLIIAFFLVRTSADVFLRTLADR